MSYNKSNLELSCKIINSEDTNDGYTFKIVNEKTGNVVWRCPVSFTCVEQAEIASYKLLNRFAKKLMDENIDLKCVGSDGEDISPRKQSQD